MMNILILPEKRDSYRALSGDKESNGRTPGQALDALRSQLTEEEAGTPGIVPSHKPDRFFDAAQQERLAELLQLREAGELSAEAESELESLVEAELRGAMQRAEALSNPQQAEGCFHTASRRFLLGARRQGKHGM